MRSLSRLVIAVSMLVVAFAVAPHSALAQDSEGGASVPVAEATAGAPEATEVLEPVTRPEESVPAASPEAAEPATKPEEVLPKAKIRPEAPLPASPLPATVKVPDKPAMPFFGGPARVDHRLQTGLAMVSGGGYRLIVPYKEGQSCGDASGNQNKRVCAHSLPMFLDFQLAFGAASRLDAILDIRFGLQSDPAVPGRHQFALAPGVRFWVDQEVALKFYSTVQFVYDYTDFSYSAGIASSDFGLRNANGLMYDPMHNLGFFAQFGETLGLRRWFRLDLEIGVGAQIRFP